MASYNLYSLNVESPIIEYPIIESPIETPIEKPIETPIESYNVDTQLLEFVVEQIGKDILTKKGIDFLFNLHTDPYHECVYYSVLLRLTELYGEMVYQKALDPTLYQRLRKYSVHSYIQFYKLKKQLTLDQIYQSHHALKQSFI